MATFAFPALGFDPAPGDPERVDALAEASTRTASDIGTAMQRLTTARRSPQWQGDAATAFDVDIGRLPTDLDRVTAAYHRAGSALREYAAQLRFAQAEAGSLEERARRIADRARAALLEDPVTQFRSRSEATEERAEVIRIARGVAERIDEAGNRSATLLLSAREAVPYRRPGPLSRTVTAVEGWIDDNAGALRTASTALKAVSAVAGLLAFVPVLTPICTPLALGTAVAALGVDAALAAAGHGSWRRLAVEAVTTVLPGGRVLRVPGTAVSRTDRFLDSANHSARGAVRADILADEPDAPRPVVPASRVDGAGSNRRNDRTRAHRSAQSPMPPRDASPQPWPNIDELPTNSTPARGRVQ
jgi:uncharacterized protein YukE